MKWILSTISLSLVACNATAPVTPIAPATISALATATPNREPSATLIATPTVMATAVIAIRPTQAPTSPIVATSAAIKANPIEASYKNIPTGVTSDGFYFLGNANAPITFTDYSDFL